MAAHSQHPIPQQALIRRLRRLCRADRRVEAAMLYGSFSRGEGDQFSDIDCVLFFADGLSSLPSPATWLGRIARVDLCYKNEFGNTVAVFAGLIRGEFHFDRVADMKQTESWRGEVWLPAVGPALLVDRKGLLAPRLQPLLVPPASRDTPADIAYLAASLVNWCLFGSHVLARGEGARAQEILRLVHDHLLRLVRLAQGLPQRWTAPTRFLESELSPPDYRRFQECSAPVETTALWRAYMACWSWGAQLLPPLAARHQVTLPEPLMQRLQRRLEDQATQA
ncbi:MAG: nucleotidyltransferase domain-containing protein [Candidatus Latescibacteria bacterium]|nr:nucleotidyltransferase domain-containing protein [Candidatus Latescibacterota bacterium]